MLVQVVNFKIQGMDHESFSKVAEEIAPYYAQVDGLVSKVFLADPATKTYCGVYTWESRSAYEAFLFSDLSIALATNPLFVDVRSTIYEIMEAPSRITRGVPSQLRKVA